MTDHDIHAGDTICDGEFTVLGVGYAYNADQVTLTAHATGDLPEWLGAPVLKISRGDWRSFLLLNELGGGYRAADGSLHTVVHIIDQAKRNGYTVEAIR